MRKLTLGVGLLAAALGCHQAPLVQASGDLELLPTEVALPGQYVGGESEVVVRVLNKGTAPLPVTWELPGGAFAVTSGDGTGLPERVPSGELELKVRFTAPRVGSFEGGLGVRASDDNFARARLTGVGLEVPPCPTPAQCHTMRFDAATQSCVEDQLADGTTCDPQSACIDGPAKCAAGLCVGKAKVCDDGNACTVDVCSALDGCQTLPAPPCPGDGECQIGVCDPKLGCGLAPAEDGTRCGSRFSCDAADVCIEGRCELRDPPDGFRCQAQSPCGQVGRCNGTACELSAPVPLKASWSLDATSSPSMQEWGDFLLEPDGAVSVFGFFATPRLRASSPAAVPAGATARRCLLWNKRLVCADFAANGRVTAVDLATGLAIWDFNVITQRPDFVALTRGRNLFMARLAEMGSDRLAALFEGYPAGTPDPTQCRLYALIVLNAAGSIVTAQRISDPLLDVCNHPHPYGFAADSAGNLFIAFSGTRNDTAPLQPDLPTLISAYTRDGIFLWKRTEPFPGGELATARGVLYPENAREAYSTATGASVASLGTLGRVVATESVVVTAPPTAPRPDGGTALEAFDTHAFAPKWTYQPPGGFGSDQLRLARWRPTANGQPEDVALFFAQPSPGEQVLTALRAKDGTPAFSCPLAGSLRTSPQLMEISNGSMVLMENATTCGKCDPPFAKSRAAFHSFPLPGIEVADVPWPGTFGGASHDHHEDGLPPPPPKN